MEAKGYLCLPRESCLTFQNLLWETQRASGPIRAGLLVDCRAGGLHSPGVVPVETATGSDLWLSTQVPRGLFHLGSKQRSWPNHMFQKRLEVRPFAWWLTPFPWILQPDPDPGSGLLLSTAQEEKAGQFRELGSGRPWHRQDGQVSWS